MNTLTAHFDLEIYQSFIVLGLALAVLVWASDFLTYRGIPRDLRKEKQAAFSWSFLGIIVLLVFVPFVQFIAVGIELLAIGTCVGLGAINAAGLRATAERRYRETHSHVLRMK